MATPQELELHDTMINDVHLDVDGKMDDRANLLPNGGFSQSSSQQMDSAAAAAASTSSPSILSKAYYQRYFDVSTYQVLWRLARSFVPPPLARPFFEEERPDLWGPLWITTTLVFATAVCGNFASYLHFTPTGDAPYWHQNVQKLTSAATAFYATTFLVPCAAWFWLRKAEAPRSLVDLIGLYGYSLTTFIPACIASIFPVEWLRWLAMTLALLFSFSFLAFNLTHPYPASPRKPPAALIVAAAIYHTALAVGTRLYFFSF